MSQSQCGLPCWALTPALSDSRPLSQESLKCPVLALGAETAFLHLSLLPAVYTHSMPCKCSAKCQRWLALPTSACHLCCSPPNFTLTPPPPLASIASGPTFSFLLFPADQAGHQGTEPH